ncbi:MAG: NosD domain-containing protein, partial [Methanosarcinales archaeon]
PECGTLLRTEKEDKKVILKGIGHPVVDAGGTRNAITLSVDGITLDGFSATNSNWRDAGGIYVDSNNNILTNNTANNNYYGIYLKSSSNNTLQNNLMSNNNYNFGLHGYTDLDFSSNNIDKSNLVDGKPIYYLVGEYQARIKIWIENTTGSNFTLLNNSYLLPRNLNYTNPNFKVFRVPNIKSGNYTWYAHLLNASTEEVVSRSSATWTFSATTSLPSEEFKVHRLDNTAFFLFLIWLIKVFNKDLISR